MRLINYDKLIKDLKDSGIPCDPDINEIITTQPVIDQAKEIERVKADLRKILDSYCSPIHFINTTEIDVEKFKEEMSKARVTNTSIYPTVTNIEMVDIGNLVREIREWVEENSLYYDDGKDPLDRTKKTIVNSPKAIPLSELNKLIAVANEKQS